MKKLLLALVAAASFGIAGSAYAGPGGCGTLTVSTPDVVAEDETTTPTEPTPSDG